jgi:hypothetical protein
VAAIAAVGDDGFGALIGEDLDLFQGLGQGVAVVGIARNAADADDEPFIEGRRHADLAAEFLPHPGLALRDAIDLRLVQRIDLFAALRLLVEQPGD